MVTDADARRRAPDPPADAAHDGARLLNELRARVSAEGLNLVGGAPVSAWDEKAPPHLRSQVLWPGALGVVVIGSAGHTLFQRFLAATDAEPARWLREHPLESHVVEALEPTEAWLRALGVRARRFEPGVSFQPAIDFVSLGQMAGFGRRGPLGLLVHETYGPWFALRAAYLLDVALPAQTAPNFPCDGCARPCLGGLEPAAAVDARPPSSSSALPSVTRWTGPALSSARARCIVGTDAMYRAEQLEYHRDYRAFVAQRRKAHGLTP